VTGGGAGGIAFGFTSSRYNINLALEALRLLSKTRTLARPRSRHGRERNRLDLAREEIPYATVSSAGTQIQFKEAVLRLDVFRPSSARATSPNQDEGHDREQLAQQHDREPRYHRRRSAGHQQSARR